MPAAAAPRLLDIAVCHAGDVVGYGAGQALGGDLCLVVRGKLGGVDYQGREEILNDLGGVDVGLFHDGGVIEIGIEELLGDDAGGFNLRAQGCEAARSVADAVQGGGAEGGDAGVHFIQ